VVKSGGLRTDLSAGVVTTYNGSTGAAIASSPVVGAVAHPNYNGVEIINDIALIKVNNVFSGVNAQIASASEVQATEDLGGIAIASGFGVTSYDGSVSSVALDVEFPLIPQSQCRQYWTQYWGASSSYESTYVCANTNLAATTCNGDSGGPLFVVVGGVRKIVGITSFGVKGCSGWSISTRVLSFVDWIQQYLTLPSSSTTVTTAPGSIFVALPGLPPFVSVIEGPQMPNQVATSKPQLPKFSTTRLFQLVLEDKGNKCLVDIDGPIPMRGTQVRLYQSKTTKLPFVKRLLDEFGDLTITAKSSCKLLRLQGIYIVPQGSTLKSRVFE